MASSRKVHIVGGGLAGSEAAWQLASAGMPVVLHEMRPVRGTEAHLTDQLAELVCSNSFRSDDAQNNAVGVIHEEMRRAGSLIMRAADAHKLPAGGGLGACCDGLAPSAQHGGRDQSIAWKQPRYDKAGPGGGGAEYGNCPRDKEQYETFVAGLLAGDKTEFKQWEASTPYFQGCQPIEVIASTGPQSLRFGPMKPVGLRDPRTGRRPWAVVQLRQDNALGTLWNIVGFQTKLKHAEQVRLFRTIPGLQNAEFARLGGLHRNTFLNSPRLLDGTLRLKALPRLRFAGQITGCEGYVESAAVGLMTGRFAAAERLGLVPATPPATTAMGALLGHITAGADAATFQPMNVNFGLFPPIEGTLRGKERKQALSARALRDFDRWLAPTPLAAE